MVLSDVSFQTPATDDIDPDSLEYLFGRHKMPTPWVKMAREPEPVARISPEMVRLQAKAETIAAQLDSVLNQLQKANIDLGFTKAQLAEKTEQLKLFADYRAKAAFVVAAETERVILNERIANLEMQLVEALEQNRALADQLALSAYKNTLNTNATVAAEACTARAANAMSMELAPDMSIQPAPALSNHSAPTVCIQPAPAVTPYDAVAPVEVADAILRHVIEEDTAILSVGAEAIIFALMICFAGLVLLNILI